MKPPSARGRAFHATRSGRLGRKVDAIPLRLHRSTHWKRARSPQMDSRRDLRHYHILPVFCPPGQHRDSREPLAGQLGAHSHKVAAEMRRRDTRRRSATKNRHIPIPNNDRLRCSHTADSGWTKCSAYRSTTGFAFASSSRETRNMNKRDPKSGGHHPCPTCYGPRRAAASSRELVHLASPRPSRPLRCTARPNQC